MFFMKRGPIGVWFSVALVIFGLSAWGGFAGGSKFARYRYEHSREALQRFYSPERIYLESELVEFRSLEFVQVLVKSTQDNRKVEKQYLVAAIAGLEKQSQESRDEKIKPVIELNLGLVYLEAAIAEQKDGNKDLAEKDMKSAQAIFQSLGWKDYSEKTLRAIAQDELDQWHEQSSEKNSGK
jgi:hypothetical protein